jgi:isoleucyl-tRNA synthetase
VYSFFVTYANIDGWEPGELVEWAIGKLGDGEADHQLTGLPFYQSTSLLDQWILARLNQVVARVTNCLENYDAYGTTMAVESLLEDLTNWYVRRSRRRFWKSEQDQDKSAAYGTLYVVLTTLCRLLAPLIPFVTEVMYQNLVRSVSAEAPESVHHTDWPEADLEAVDEEILRQMALARDVVALGHSARNSQNIKLRQPLARALVHREAGDSDLSDELMALVVDELNVKRVAFVDDPGELVAYRLLPDNKVLGPRFGKRFPALRAALEALDPSAAVRRLRAGLPLELAVEGETVELAPEEVLVREEPGEGLAVASERGATVAVDTVLTPELRMEGLAREVVRRVQNLRKEAGFNLDDRIFTTYETEGELGEAIEAWQPFIAAETLSVSLQAGPPEEKATVGEDQVDGHALRLGIRRA